MPQSPRHLFDVVLALLVLFFGPSCARADQAMFTFGEMRRLQALPAEAAERPLSEEEIILYRNMQFYALTVFESLVAANNAVLTLYKKPLFCAPAGVFHFRDEGDLLGLAAHAADELLTLTERIGASRGRYDEKPASEVLLLALRAAFPCDKGRSLAPAKAPARGGSAAP